MFPTCRRVMDAKHKGTCKFYPYLLVVWEESLLYRRGTGKQAENLQKVAGKSVKKCKCVSCGDVRYSCFTNLVCCPDSRAGKKELCSSMVTTLVATGKLDLRKHCTFLAPGYRKGAMR